MEILISQHGLVYFQVFKTSTRGHEDLHKFTILNTEDEHWFYLVETKEGPGKRMLKFLGTCNVSYPSDLSPLFPLKVS